MINLNLNKVFVKLLFFFLHYILFSFSDRPVCTWLGNWKKEDLWNQIEIIRASWGTLGSTARDPTSGELPTHLLLHWHAVKRLTVLSFSKAQSSQNFVVESSAALFESWKTCGESRVDLLAHEKRGPDCLNPNGANLNLDTTGSHAILLRLGTPNPATSFNNCGSYHMG